MKVKAINDLRNSGNIAQFNVKLSGGEAEAGGELLVSIEGSSRVYKRSISPSDTRVTIGVHTHLLPPGKSTAKFVLCPARERRRFPFYSAKRTEESVEIEIDNPLRETELASSVAATLRTHDVPEIFFGPCDSSYYPYDDATMKPWFDRPDANERVRKWAESGLIDEDFAKRLEQFVDEGFVVFDKIIDDALIDQINREIDEAIAEKYKGYEYGSSKRIEHLHFTKPGIRKLFGHSELLKVGSFIFQDPARPSQTLTFVFGSQQDAHQDTIHLTPFPAGYMCGIWIALQDVIEGSGELEVFPGSHREPRIYMKDTDCQKVTTGDWSDFGKKVVPLWREISQRYKSKKYLPKKGTVLIWHENLLHAGSVRSDLSLERRSIVIHAFAQDAIVYYDSSGSVGTIAAPELHVHEPED